MHLVDLLQMLLKKMPKQIPRSSNYGNSTRKLHSTLDRSNTTIDTSHQKQQNNNNRELIETKQQEIDLLKKEIASLRGNTSANRSRRKYQFWRNVKRYLTQIDFGSAHQPRFSLNQVLFSYIGSFIGIATLAYLSVGSGYPLIAAPFGAAAVLVFAVPDAALAQPRNLIFGNLLGAIVSVVMVFIFGSEPWVMALAVATAIKLMQLTKTLHPPGGAVALVGVMSEAEASFIIIPVLIGSIVLLFCTVVFNNLMPGRSYPKR